MTIRPLRVLATGSARRRFDQVAPTLTCIAAGSKPDNLAESIYRGLMRALAATGNHAEALAAFRRCRELLSIVLGLKPSQATERLYRDIVAGHANR